MRKISYRPIYNRKKKLNAHGTALIQVEAYLEKKKVYFSTHIYVTPTQWNKKRRLIINHPNAESLNVMLRAFIVDLERKELELWRDRQEISLNKLKEEFHYKMGQSFLNFVKNEIESSVIKDSTKNNRLTTYHLLAKFKPGLEHKDITSKFVFEFEKYLYDNKMKTNTVAKHMKHLKAFVNAAINKEYIHINDYPFRRYHIKTKDTKHTFLTPEELYKLELLAEQGIYPPLDHTLDAFLFCCYTGIRYSDFSSMNEKNIVRIGGKPWLVFQTIKTGAEVKLPIGLLFDGKPWKMLQKYKNNLSHFFEVLPNSHLNKHLIRIGKIAGITKHFSFHSARHTNATLLIHKGANITTVQKLLGHRDLSTTQIYSEVMESTIVKDLKKCVKKS